MKVRACMLILLLMGQPLSAVSAALESSGSNDSIAGHCDTETMTEQHQSAAGDTDSNGHSSCDDSCDLCAACAATVNAGIAAELQHARSGNSPPLLLVTPPGETELLYRPPIQS